MNTTTIKKIEKRMFALTAEIAKARAVGNYDYAAQVERELAELYAARWA